MLCRLQVIRHTPKWGAVRLLSTQPPQEELPKNPPGPSWMKNSGRQRLVVLGAGWAAYRIIRDIDIEKYDLTVVSPRNHFLFTPLLPSTTVGTLEFRGIIEPIRTARERLNYVQFSCTGVDEEKQILTAESYYDNSTQEKEKIQLRYDKLVIAVGAQSATFGVEGVTDYCYFLKQLSDARLIRNRILECFERASSPRVSEEEKKRLLSFVVVGGGPTSIEFAASLHDFCAKDVTKWYPELYSRVSITVVEAGPKVLSAFEDSLSQYCHKQYKKQNIDVRTNVSVKKVGPHVMELSDGSSLPFGCGVWSAGNASVPLLSQLAFEKEGGRLVVDEYLRIGGKDNIFAAGDCCIIEGNNLPPTAQVAEQQGKTIAKNLNYSSSSSPPSSALPSLTPFKFHYKGMFAYTGQFSALLDSPFGSTKGFVSWVLYVGTYLTKLVSVRNKIMIPMYWFKSFVFGRDISKF